MGLKMELSGALGKRTRFQEKELAQLLLTVSPASSRGEGEGPLRVPDEVEKVVPKNLQLQDDTLLDRVAYSDPEATPTLRLTSLEQAVVLGQW